MRGVWPFSAWREASNEFDADRGREVAVFSALDRQCFSLLINQICIWKTVAYRPPGTKLV